MTTSKKSFHLVYDDGIRRMRLMFDAAVHSKYNPDTMFHPIWESSNFFDMFLPENVTYGEVSTFGSDTGNMNRAVEFFEHVGRDGIYGKNMPVNRTHRVIYGDWEDHGISVVVPVGLGVRSLVDLGVHLVMASEADKLRVRKYFRRVRAHHEWAIAGIVADSYAAKNGQVLRIVCGDEVQMQFDVLHVNIDEFDDHNKALVDGVHFISVNLCRALGHMYNIEKLKTAQAGDAFKGTMFSQLGLGKGFFHVVDMEDYGIILYGPKTQIKFDKFFLGSLGDVKGGEARTCIQSLGAFINTETTLWKDLSDLFINEVSEAIHDEDKLRHLFLTNIQSIADVGNSDTESWVLVEAFKHGVPILRNPGLFRKVVRHLMFKVLDCEHGRIPYGPVAHRYNLMPDLTCFDFSNGDVDYTKSLIPENAVICMDAGIGPFAMYRQPLGNAKEAVVAVNIHSRRYKKYIGRERVILGLSVMEQLQRMGGGDFDDAVIGTDNIDWVEVIAKSDYPVTKLAPAELEMVYPLDEDNKYMRRRSYPAVWSMQDYFDAAVKATEQQLSIGPVDNAIRLDLLLSGENKQNMLVDLAQRIDSEENADVKDKLTKAFVWLQDREDYQLREVASNLEHFIDYIKLGKGNPAVLEPLVSKMSDVRDSSLVLPECWTYLGRGGKGRISVARQMAQDYVLAPSLPCATLNAIRLERDKLVEALRDEEWMMVERIPESLNLSFPRDKGTYDEALELRMIWRDTWDPFLTGQTTIDVTSAYKIILNGGKVTLQSGEVIDVEGIRSKFNQWDPEIRMSLAVEVARQTYRTRHSTALRGDDGRRRGFSDGLLWTNTIGLFYIQAMKEAGLTGLYLPVKFDKYSRNLSRGSVQVKVIGGIVERLADGFMIGYVMDETNPEDGEYTMKDGMLCVQEPSEELTRSILDVEGDFLNPIDLSSDSAEV
jgi:hypothetical protein